MFVAVKYNFSKVIYKVLGNGVKPRDEVEELGIAIPNANTPYMGGYSYKRVKEVWENGKKSESKIVWFLAYQTPFPNSYEDKTVCVGSFEECEEFLK